MGEKREVTQDHRARPLAGLRGWIITDGKAGHELQCLGVARALGLDVELKPIAKPGRLYGLRAPYGPPPRAARFGRAESGFGPPYPDIALATGRLTTPYIRALKTKAGLTTFTVILLDPKVKASAADLFWVPEHDKRRGPNVITTLTSPHQYSRDRLAELRAHVPGDIARLPQLRYAVLIGGPNGDYTYGAQDQDRLVECLKGLVASGAGLMITPSRRTPPDLLARIEEATRAAPRILWSGTGDNPYPHFLAHADAFLVTADSVNMVGEAAATGRPIHVFHPSGGSAKFSRFHAALEAKGVTRRLAETGAELASWTYTPIDSAQVIADEIARRWAKRLELLSGLCGRDKSL